MTELRCVIGEDPLRKSTSQEDFPLEERCDDLKDRLWNREGLDPPGKHIRCHQDKTLTPCRPRVRAQYVERHGLLWVLESSDVGWSWGYRV
jgi:hypothetical protein